MIEIDTGCRVCRGGGRRKGLLVWTLGIAHGPVIGKASQAVNSAPPMIDRLRPSRNRSGQGGVNRARLSP
jgi:hypothetical protein